MADLEHVRWIRRPELRRPHVIAAFTGWNDAADAASTAVKHLVENLGAAPLAEINPEEFTDFATMSIDKDKRLPASQIKYAPIGSMKLLTL